MLSVKCQSEEFSIYLNYVRKLGFEETPDYDFLRELFAKVLKNNGDMEDHVYDWNLLNNGRGWDASSQASPINVLECLCFLTYLPLSDARTTERRRIAAQGRSETRVGAETVASATHTRRRGYASVCRCACQCAGISRW